MVDPTPPHVTPEYLKLLAESLDRRIERPEELKDASRLRQALYPAPKPTPARRPPRFRLQYLDRRNQWRTVHRNRRR